MIFHDIPMGERDRTRASRNARRQRWNSRGKSIKHAKNCTGGV